MSDRAAPPAAGKATAKGKGKPRPPRADPRYPERPALEGFTVPE